MKREYQNVRYSLFLASAELDRVSAALEVARDDRWRLEEYLDATGQTEDYQQFKEALELS